MGLAVEITKEPHISFDSLAGWRQVGLGEKCAEGVFGANGWWDAIEGFEGPGDVESGVVPEDGALTGRVVEVGGLVEDLGGVGEDEKAVGEAFGDPEELEFVVGGFGSEVEPCPFTEIRGVAAKIDSDVPDMAGENADELALRLTELVVQAAEHAFDGERLVVLNELGGKSGCGKC
jgi:hypothetical protein